MEVDEDLQVIFEAFPNAVGICNANGGWLLVNSKLASKLAELNNPDFARLLVQPDRWPSLKKLIRRNRRFVMLSFRLCPPFEDSVCHTTRLRLKSLLKAEFLVEFRSRKDHLRGFSEIERQHQTELDYQRDRLDLRRTLDLAEIDAHTDQLTEIANRRSFDEYVQLNWKRAINERRELSLCMIDIDYFKEVNDVQGHAHGDLVLKQVAMALKTGLRRPTDFIARIGGEEFGLLLPDTDEGGARKLSDQLVQCVLDLDIKHPTGRAHPNISVSIGYISGKPSPSDSFEAFLNQADSALYQAKQAGRNRIAVYTGGPEQHGSEAQFGGISKLR